MIRRPVAEKSLTMPCSTTMSLARNRGRCRPSGPCSLAILASAVHIVIVNRSPKSGVGATGLDRGVTIWGGLCGLWKIGGRWEVRERGSLGCGVCEGGLRAGVGWRGLGERAPNLS